MSGNRLTEEQRVRVFAMLHKGASDLTIARAVGCDPSSVYHHRERLGLGTARRQVHGLRQVCVRAGCDCAPEPGARTCANHSGNVAAVLTDSGFVRAPSRAQMMARR